MQSKNPAGAGFVRTAMPSERKTDKHRRSRRALARLLPVLRKEGHQQKYRALNLFCQDLEVCAAAYLTRPSCKAAYSILLG